MRFARKEDVSIGVGDNGSPKLTFDGTDVLLGGAIAIAVLTAFIKSWQPVGWWIAIGLGVIWLVVTLVTNLRSKKA